MSDLFDLENVMSVFLVSVAGIPLALPVLLLVEYLKNLGLQGKQLLLSSLGIGTALGTGYQLLLGEVPLTPAGIFTALLYGLTLGLLASKSFDLIQSTARNEFLRYRLQSAAQALDKSAPDELLKAVELKDRLAKK